MNQNTDFIFTSDALIFTSSNSSSIFFPDKVLFRITKEKSKLVRVFFKSIKMHTNLYYSRNNQQENGEHRIIKWIINENMTAIITIETTVRKLSDIGTTLGWLFIIKYGG